MKNIILTLLMGLLLVGCTNVMVDPVSITDLREFTIDEGLHIVVGVGKWSEDKKQFLIESYDGQQWEVSSSVRIEENKVTLDSFKRVTQ